LKTSEIAAKDAAFALTACLSAATDHLAILSWYLSEAAVTTEASLDSFVLKACAKASILLTSMDVILTTSDRL
jgi:hypothetical protein